MNNTVVAYDQEIDYSAFAVLTESIEHFLMHGQTEINTNRVGLQRPEKEIRVLFQVDEYHLAQGLRIEITHEDNIYFAKNDLFNVWGDGETLEEAINSLERFLLYDFKSYSNTPEEKLDYFAKIERQRYRWLFQVA